MLERQLYIALSSSSWAVGFGGLLTLLFTGPTFGIRAVRTQHRFHPSRADMGLILLHNHPAKSC